MSMASIREIVTDKLGDKGALTKATMTCENGGRSQLLTLVIDKPDGTKVTLEESVPASTDLIQHAASMATAWAAT